MSDCFQQRGQEVEIKLVTTPARLETLLNAPVLKGTAPASGTQAKLNTTYLDAADWRLREAGYYLRTRHRHGRRELTLKGGGDADGLARGEWTGVLEGVAPDPAVLPEPAHTLAVGLLDNAPLRPFARIEGSRTTRTITNGRAVIEAAFDQGAIKAKSARAEICELELEVRQGRLADALRLALKLPLGRDLLWSTDSKADRAWRLATGGQPQAVKASPLSLAPGMTAEAGFQRIAWNCLHQLLANYAQVIERGDPEALHQTRVALRRLRAALSIHKDLVADARFERLKAELREATAALGRARDLDVLIARLTQVQAQEGIAPLLEALGRQRTQSYARARALLGSAGFQRLLFRTALWVVDGPWRDRMAVTTVAEGALAATALASARLRRFRKAIKQAPHDLAKLDAAARHALRIRVKKLRYANEFFEGLWAGAKRARRQQALGQALERLQDRLGELNDLETQQSIALDCASDGQTQAEAAAALERALRQSRQSAAKLMKAANKARDDVLAMQRFWKRKGKPKAASEAGQAMDADAGPQARV